MEFSKTFFVLLVILQGILHFTVASKVQVCQSDQETYCGKEPCKCGYPEEKNSKREESCQCMKYCKVKEKNECYNGVCDDGHCICKKCWTGNACNKYVNNYEPTFEQSDYHMVMSKDSPPGSEVITVTATDQDLTETCGDGTNCSCAEIKYQIVSGNDNGYFSLNENTGKLTVMSTDDKFLSKDVKLIIVAKNPDIAMNNKEIESNEENVTTVYITRKGNDLQHKRKRVRRSGQLNPQLNAQVSHTNATSLLQGSVYEYKTIIKHGVNSMADAYGVKIRWALPPYIKYQSLISALPAENQPIISVSDAYVEFKYLIVNWINVITIVFEVVFDPEKNLEPGRHHIVSPVYVTYYGQKYSENSQGEITDKGTFFSVPVKMYTFDVITTGCAAPLGLGDGKIKDFQITASTAHPNTPSHNSRPTLDGWCAMISDNAQFLQVDFFSQVRISKVATWGRSRKGNWVTRYNIKFSLDDIEWYYYMENGKNKIFKGNVDRESASTHWLVYPIKASHIRIIPLEWKNQICMRLELYGCTDKGAQENCLYPLGMESGWISDEAISGSSDSEPFTSRLNKAVSTYPYGWMGSKDGTAYLQIDFGSIYRITRVATQGAWVQSASEFPPYYTKAYELELSNNSYIWYKYKENGQVKRLIGNTQDENAGIGVYSKMKTFVVARYIRIYPVEFKELPVLRAEVYGCLYEPNFGKALPEFSRRTFLLDRYKNKVYICLLRPRRLTESHCYSTTDGITWKELSNEVCSIFGLDKQNGYLYGIGHLGQKYYVSKDGGVSWKVITNDEWVHRYPNLNLARAVNVPDNLVSTTPTTDFTLTANNGQKWGVSGYGVHKVENEMWLNIATWDCCFA